MSVNLNLRQQGELLSEAVDAEPCAVCKASRTELRLAGTYRFRRDGTMNTYPTWYVFCPNICLESRSVGSPSKEKAIALWNAAQKAYMAKELPKA